MTEVERRAEPVDELIAVRDGLRLRVLRWEPDTASAAGAASGRAVAAGRAAAGQAAAGRSPAAGVAAGPISSPPFLLVHGLASNARLWDGVGRRLAESWRRAAAVDLRGHGRSDKPDSGYDFASISDDLRSLVGALAFDRPIVAGQSWGASVVLDLAVRYPSLVSGIVLVDGGLTDMHAAFPSWDACWERLAPPQLVGLPLSTIEGYFRNNHADWPPEGIEGSFGNFEVRADGTIAPWLSREHHKAILRAMWEQRTSELWRSLRVPALIVPVDGGQSDWTRGKREGAESAVALLQATGTPVAVRWFEGDHDIHAQHPDDLTEAVLEAERAGLFGARP